MSNRHHISVIAALITAATLSASTATAALPARPSAQGAPAPKLTLTSDRTAVKAGDRVILRWIASGARNCAASGAWSGNPRTAGLVRTNPLTASSTFTLTCSTPVGSVSRSVTVQVASGAQSPNAGNSTPSNPGAPAASAGNGTAAPGSISTSTPAPTPTPAVPPVSAVTPPPSVTPAPAPTPVVAPVEPKLDIRVSSTAVKRGGNVTVSWTGTGVSNCRASGAWSGSRDMSGSEVRSALSTGESYTLVCDSARGQIMAMTAVQVLGSASIAWQAPSHNVDGTAIQGLSGYRIHVGNVSGSYSQTISLNNPSALTTTLDLVPGEYFIALSVIDSAGNESALSNEVKRTVQ
jgi:hypothetical protein